jgi:hypothetical protein
MGRRFKSGNYELFDAKAATGASKIIDVTDYREIVVAVTAAINSSLIYKFQGSIGKSLSSADAPDFAAAQAVTNHWDYVASYDLQSPGSVIPGDTGVTIDNAAVAANTTLYVINVSLLRHFAMSVTTYTDGALTAWVMAASE